MIDLLEEALHNDTLRCVWQKEEAGGLLEITAHRHRSRVSVDRSWDSTSRPDRSSRTPMQMLASI